MKKTSKMEETIQTGQIRLFMIVWTFHLTMRKLPVAQITLQKDHTLMRMIRSTWAPKKIKMIAMAVETFLETNHPIHMAHKMQVIHFRAM
jgi:hypothetical protein